MNVDRVEEDFIEFVIQDIEEMQSRISVVNEENRILNIKRNTLIKDKQNLLQENKVYSDKCIIEQDNAGEIEQNKLTFSRIKYYLKSNKYIYRVASFVYRVLLWIKKLIVK